MELFIGVCIISLIVLLPSIGFIVYQSYLQRKACINFNKNPKLRLKTYEFILKKLEDPNTDTKGFCYIIRMFNRKHSYSINNNSLTELNKYEPKILTESGYWFKLSDVDSRIEIIKKCISEVKEIIKSK